MDPKHLLHQLMVELTTAYEERLRSRHPFVPAPRKLLNELSIRAAQWTDCKCTTKANRGYASLSKGPAPGHLAWVCPDLLEYNLPSL